MAPKQDDKSHIAVGAGAIRWLRVSDPKQRPVWRGRRLSRDSAAASGRPGPGERVDGRQGRVSQAWAPRGSAQRCHPGDCRPSRPRRRGPGPPRGGAPRPLRPHRHERKRKRRRAARAPGVPREDDAQARRGARGPAAERAGEQGVGGRPPAGRPALARVAEGLAGRPGPAARGEPRVRREEGHRRREHSARGPRVATARGP